MSKDLRWTLSAIEPYETYNGGDGNACVEGPPLPENIEELVLVPFDLMRELKIARARGLATAIAECRDDARLDGIREGAAEIVKLLKEADDEAGPCDECAVGDLKPISHKANRVDWNGPGSSQSYQVYRCRRCDSYWGCRRQYDAGTGRDDRWHRFANLDDVRRHY